MIWDLRDLRRAGSVMTVTTVVLCDVPQTDDAAAGWFIGHRTPREANQMLYTFSGRDYHTVLYTPKGRRVSSTIIIVVS